MWNIVLNILKSDFVQKILLVGIITLMFLILFRQCETNKAITWEAEQTRRALTDTMHVITDRVGELSWEKTAFAAKLEDMKKLNEKLYNEAKDINGKVKTLQNVDVQLLIDEIRKAKNTDVTVKKTDSADYYTFLWNEPFTRGSFKSFLEGFTTVRHQHLPTDTVNYADVTITRQQFALALKTYIYEDKDGYLIGGVAPLKETPGLTFSLETGIFDPVMSKKFQSASKPQSIIFGFGPYFGVGYGNIWNPGGTPSSYNGFGWSVGLGFTLSYKIFGF